jgi:hypothetical protein
MSESFGIKSSLMRGIRRLGSWKFRWLLRSRIDTFGFEWAFNVAGVQMTMAVPAARKLKLRLENAKPGTYLR